MSQAAGSGERKARGVRCVRYELIVVSAAPGRPWRATLRCLTDARCIEFGSPEELARYVSGPAAVKSNGLR